MNDPQTITSTLEKIKVMQAFCDGKEIQCLNKYESDDTYDTTDYPVWNWDKFDYRVKPTPNLRLWTIDEVPLDAWYRSNDEDGSELVRIDTVSVKRTTINIAGTWYSLNNLMAWFEHSLDQGKTWRVCGKEEV